MRSVYRRLLLAVSLFCVVQFTAAAQQTTVADTGNLFSSGYAAGFIGGLYDAYYPVTALKQHGDFGIGAPSMLDGELIMLRGKVYKTQFTGKTVTVSDTAKIPYAVVCFFKADRVYKPGKGLTKVALFHYLDSILDNQNGIYAIRFSGSFRYLKTRAFPPVQGKPYLPLAAIAGQATLF